MSQVWKYLNTCYLVLKSKPQISTLLIIPLITLTSSTGSIYLLSMIFHSYLVQKQNDPYTSSQTEGLSNLLVETLSSILYEVHSKLCSQGMCLLQQSYLLNSIYLVLYHKISYKISYFFKSIFQLDFPKPAASFSQDHALSFWMPHQT